MPWLKSKATSPLHRFTASSLHPFTISPLPLPPTPTSKPRKPPTKTLTESRCHLKCFRDVFEDEATVLKRLADLADLAELEPAQKLQPDASLLHHFRCSRHQHRHQHPSLASQVLLYRQGLHPAQHWGTTIPWEASCRHDRTPSTQPVAVSSTFLIFFLLAPTFLVSRFLYSSLVPRLAPRPQSARQMSSKTSSPPSPSAGRLSPVLSIPAQWTIEFEEVYRGIATSVFKTVVPYAGASSALPFLGLVPLARRPPKIPIDGCPRQKGRC